MEMADKIRKCGRPIIPVFRYYCHAAAAKPQTAAVVKTGPGK
jgi:hypothetical protein